MYICFAASPIQLICFKELICKYNIRNYTIHLLVSSCSQSNKQLNYTINFLKLKNVKKLKCNSLKFFQIFRRYLFLFQIYFMYKDKKCIFVISDFRNTIYHQIRLLFQKSKFIFIDDGSQVPFYYNQYFKKNIFFPYHDYKNFYGKLKILINYFFKLHILINFKFEIFTIYGKELGLKNKFHNKLGFVKNYINVNQAYCKSYVYLIGAKFSEQNFLSINEEIDAIIKVNNYWVKKKKRIIYIAKRTTSKKKIDLIKKKIGIKVLMCDLPVELYFLKKSSIKIPKIICSFGSAADKTIPMIYKKSIIYLVSIKELSKYSFFLNYYKFYKKLIIKSKFKNNIIKL